MRWLLLSTIIFSLISTSFAAEKTKDGEAAPEVGYYRLYPDFITNLKSPGKQTFIQIRVNVMVNAKADAKEVEHHEPLLRDKLILLFNSKAKNELRSFAGRQKMQEQA